MLSIKEMFAVMVVCVGGFLVATFVLLGGGNGHGARTGAPHASAPLSSSQPATVPVAKITVAGPSQYLSWSL